MSLTIKIPVKDVKKDIGETVEETLKTDKNNAYTVMGLMVEKFGAKEGGLNGKPFSEWEKGLPSLYTKIRISLEKLKREGKIESKKSGKAYVYWWK